MRTALVVVAVLLVGGLLNPSVSASPIWEISPINGHSYTLIAGSSWPDAENQAVALGGHLTTIRNSEENDWLHPWLESITGPQWWVWTGLYQIPGSSEPFGGWEWISGEPVTYTNWSAGEPNDYYGSGDPENWCGYYIRVQAPDREFPKHWLDVRDEQSFGIVEVTSAIPEPTTATVFTTGLFGLFLLLRRRRL